MFRLLLSRPLAESEAAAWTTDEEQSLARTFRSERRRREWLTWRALVRRELNSTALRFGYDDAGAPFIERSALRLGVSHCAGSIAVALSETPCAVDIELLARDFSRAAPRYMTSEERMLAEDPHWPAVVWCAKEALYKYAGRRELDLLRDLRIERVDAAADFRSGRLAGRIGGGGALTLHFLVLDGRAVVFLSQP